MVTVLLVLLSILFVFVFPHGTSIPYSRRPVVTVGIALGLVGIHVLTQLLAFASYGATPVPFAQLLRGLTGFASQETWFDWYIGTFAINPMKVWEQPWRGYTVVTHALLHGGWIHLITNLWFFVLFGINLENRFGPYKFGAFVLGAAAAGGAAILALNWGTSGEAMPHLGFSGVVYAVMAAFLAIYSRSKVRCLFVTDPIFWIFAVIVLPITAMLTLFYVGDMWELVYLALLALTFSALNPNYWSFAWPAWFFLGFRLLHDAYFLQRLMESNVSVWCHLGGAAFGLAVGLVSLLRNPMGESWEPQDVPAWHVWMGKKKAEQDQPIEAPRPEQSPDLARIFLVQRVRMRDANALADFYRRGIMDKYADIVLDAPDQLAMARFLEMKGYNEEALHAYEALTRAATRGPELEDALLKVAGLLENCKGREADALAAVERLLTLNPLNRTKLLARRLAERIQSKGESPATADEAHADAPAEIPRQGAAAAADAGLELPRIALPQGKLLKATRVQQIETTTPVELPSPEQPDEDEDERPGGYAPAGGAPRKSGGLGDAESKPLGGKAPLPLSAKNHPRFTGETPAGDEPPSGPPSSSRFIAVSESQRRTGRPRNASATTAGETGPAEIIAAGLQHSPPPSDSIYVDPTAIPPLAMAALRDEQNWEIAHVPVKPPQTGAACFIDWGGRTADDALLRRLEDACGLVPGALAATAEQAATLLLMPLRLEQAERAAEVARSAGCQVTLYPAAPAPLNRPPLEIRSFATDGPELLLTTADGAAVRLRRDDVRCVRWFLVRLSEKSSSLHECLEIIGQEPAARMQIWARTMSASRLDGETIARGEAALTALAGWLARWLAGTGACALLDRPLQFRTFGACENHLGTLLLRGQPPPE